MHQIVGAVPVPVWKSRFALLAECGAVCTDFLQTFSVGGLYLGHTVCIHVAQTGRTGALLLQIIKPCGFIVESSVHDLQVRLHFLQFDRIYRGILLGTYGIELLVQFGTCLISRIVLYRIVLLGQLLDFRINRREILMAPAFAPAEQ